MVSLLAVVAVVVWTSVLTTAGRATGVAACPAPAVAAKQPGTVVPVSALTAAPVPPAAVRITVFNAGGQRGQANLVAAQLGDLGFVQGGAPGNDPLFPAGAMDCIAEIRFGPAGLAAAGTLALVVPCAELLRDSRTDDGVDLAVGTDFGDLTPGRAAKDALDQLGAAPGGAGGGAGDPNVVPAPPVPPKVDRTTLAAARTCT